MGLSMRAIARQNSILSSHGADAPSSPPFLCMKYDITDLKLLLAVADSGQVLAGGAACLLSASAARQRLQQLETVVGSTLFDRHPRGVTATSAGAALIEHARRCMAALSALRDDLTRHADGVTSRLRLVTTPSCAGVNMVDGLRATFTDCVGLTVTVEEHPASQVVALVASHGADVGVLDLDLHHDGVLVCADSSVEHVALIPKGWYPAIKQRLGVDDCRSWPLIALNHSSAVQQFLEGCGSTEAWPTHVLDVRATVPNYAAMIAMVEAQVGVGVMPRSALRHHLPERTRVAALDATWASWPIRLCVPRRTVGIQL